jgi:hypothetical protein
MLTPLMAWTGICGIGMRHRAQGLASRVIPMCFNTRGRRLAYVLAFCERSSSGRSALANRSGSGRQSPRGSSERREPGTTAVPVSPTAGSAPLKVARSAGSGVSRREKRDAKTRIRRQGSYTRWGPPQIKNSTRRDQIRHTNPASDIIQNALAKR